MTFIVTGVDKNTQDIITYITEKAGGKIIDEKAGKKKVALKKDEVHENILDARKQLDDIKRNLIKKYNETAKVKIKPGSYSFY